MKSGLAILIHGDSGVGKSWLAGTAPPPTLILDLEGRARYLPAHIAPGKVSWDPSQPPPQPDGTWSHCIVTATKFQTLELVYQWLQSGQTPFKSVVIDSLMEAQKRFIDGLAGTKTLEQQDWGDVLRTLERAVRDYRDLTIVESNGVQVVVLTVGTKTNPAGKLAPLLQGQLQLTLPFYMDAVGYLYPVHDNGTVQRNLLVQPTQLVVAKDGTDSLGGPVIENPNLTELFSRLERNA